jgi:hypothetical protein
MNTRLARSTGAEVHIPCLFVLQPMLTSKKGLTPFETEFFNSLTVGQVRFIRQFYQRVNEQMHAQPDYVDLSGLFDHDGCTDFYDLGHGSPLSRKTIGRALTEKMLADKRWAPHSILPQ